MVIFIRVDFLPDSDPVLIPRECKYEVDYSNIGRLQIPNEELLQEYTVDENTKLSIHESGFVQFSGGGIISGIDQQTGQPKGARKDRARQSLP